MTCRCLVGFVWTVGRPHVYRLSLWAEHRQTTHDVCACCIATLPHATKWRPQTPAINVSLLKAQLSLHILLSHSRSLRSFEMTPSSRAYVRFYQYFIVTVCVSHESWRFWDIQRQIMAWPWNLRLGLFKVIENDTIRKLGYGFLFAFHSNYGPILYHFRDKARYW